MNWNNCKFRFLSIDIENIKNIGYGKLSVNGYTEKKGWSSYNYEKADVFGIYGQNGSGKSSAIEAMFILKLLVSGVAFYDKKRDENFLSKFITINKNTIHLSAQFLINDENETNLIKYDVTFYAEKKNEIYIQNESFYVHPLHSVKAISKIDYTVDTPTLIEPKTLYKALKKDSKENIIVMEMCNRLNKMNSTSFLFQKQKEEIKNLYNIDEVFNYLTCFQKYIKSNFIIIPQDFTSFSLRCDTLPLEIKEVIEDENEYIGLQYLFSQSLSIQKTKEAVSYINELDTVISSIIPDFHIRLKIVGPQLARNGETENVVEVVCNRNSIELPLSNESSGVKKLLSILHALIVVHNKSDIFIGIDDIDSNISEYLIGEILSMISESGQGQLFFTAHNLYPLELLNKNCVYFTTTNMDNRFIHFKYLKPKHNLRNEYLKTIRLGGQDEEIYKSFKIGKIRLAFHSAGKEVKAFVDDKVNFESGE